MVNLDDDTKTWMTLLHPDPDMQRSIIEELLKHKIGDNMSSDDIATCRKALDFLKEQRIARSRLIGNSRNVVV